MFRREYPDPDISPFPALKWSVIAISVVSLLLSEAVSAQLLPGFKPSCSFGEQELYLEDNTGGTRILVNAPMEGFGEDARITLILYALPNGNTIEQTYGKRIGKDEDWHFAIQHIAAQTRFIRKRINDRTTVVAYLQTTGRSWPKWVAETPDSLNRIRNIVERLEHLFSNWDTEIHLCSHSGGGRFIFSYIDAVEEIPGKVKRIGFIDSNYGYEDSTAGKKLSEWLNGNPDSKLAVLSYNDSVVIYNGKPLVSPRGGTWHRSRMMVNRLGKDITIERKERGSLIWYKAKEGGLEIVLKKNPRGKIFHTVQVERNGFVHSQLHGTPAENKGYRYFGRRVYDRMISDSVFFPVRQFNIPGRSVSALSGSQFMKAVDTLSRERREMAILKEFAEGNIPSFLRTSVTIKGEGADTAGQKHLFELEVMPDYLAIGNDTDFCRIPMDPYTAQRIADLYGGSLITSKISDLIYSYSDLKLIPFNYVPVGNANELVSKFAEHNMQIEKQFADSLGKRGMLVAGIKKDIILSARIGSQPGKVVIYGWHKPGGVPIQPVYSGHIWWYTDYSHGVRLINNQVVLDGKKVLFSDIIADPLLFKVFSGENKPVFVTYRKQP